MLSFMAAAAALVTFAAPGTAGGIGLGIGGTLTLAPVMPSNPTTAYWTATAVFPSDVALSAPPVNLYRSPTISTEHAMVCAPGQASQDWTKEAVMTAVVGEPFTYTHTFAAAHGHFYCAVTNNGTGWSTNPLYI